MHKKNYFVHKNTVQSYRKALVTYLFSINRAGDIPDIMSHCSNLDSFAGDKIPLDIVNNEFDIAVMLFQDEYLWLKVIDYIDIKDILLYRGIRLSINSLSNENIEIPFTIVCRLVTNYMMLMTDGINIKLTEKKSSICLEFESAITYTLSKHHLDAIILIVHKILYLFSNKIPEAISLSYREKKQDSLLYRKYLGTPTDNLSEKKYLCYKPKACRANKSFFVLTNEFRASLKNYAFISPLHSLFVESSSDVSYSLQCYHILVTTMGVIYPTREQVATVMNMSISSMQRHLKKEGTTFQEILLKIRKELSHKYLIEQNLSPTSVAFLLGYKSSSQFFTAFKSWFHVTPKIYQKSNNNLVA